MTIAFSGIASGDVVIDVSDDVPGTGDTYTTSLGSIARDSDIDVLPLVYRVFDLDLTSEGGTANETFTYMVSFTATGGNPLTNNFGNVAVDGGNDQQIESVVPETLTTTISLVSSSFANLSLNGFNQMRFGGFGDAETADLTHGGGTDSVNGQTDIYTISGNSFTITPTTQSTGAESALNLRAFNASFTATVVPEPTSFAFLSIMFGMIGLRRRK